MRKLFAGILGVFLLMLSLPHAQARTTSAVYAGVEGEMEGAYRQLFEDYPKVRLEPKGIDFGFRAGIDFSPQVSLEGFYHLRRKHSVTFYFTEPATGGFNLSDQLLEARRAGGLLKFYLRDDRDIGRWSDVQPFVGLGFSQYRLNLTTKEGTEVIPSTSLNSLDVRLGFEFPFAPFLRLDVGLEQSFIDTSKLPSVAKPGRYKARRLTAFAGAVLVFPLAQEANRKAPKETPASPPPQAEKPVDSSGPQCPTLPDPKYFSCPER